MEHYKTSKLLNDSTVSKIGTKKWIEVNDLSSSQYSVNKKIRFKILILRSDWCDYSDAYIRYFSCCCSIKNDKAEKNVMFKNIDAFRSCISKANSTLIDNAEDLDIFMPRLEYSPNQELYGVIIETKLMMRMIMLQMVNHLNKK